MTAWNGTLLAGPVGTDGRTKGPSRSRPDMSLLWSATTELGEETMLVFVFGVSPDVQPQTVDKYGSWTDGDDTNDGRIRSYWTECVGGFLN